MAVLRWLSRFFADESVVSDTWLKAQDAKMSRVDYEGVSIRWPINKAINESSKWNTKRLRRIS